MQTYDVGGCIVGPSLGGGASIRCLHCPWEVHGVLYDYTIGKVVADHAKICGGRQADKKL
jgi:hypothetical protein